MYPAVEIITIKRGDKMLLSPESYIKMLEKSSLDELKEERDGLIKSITEYEKAKKEGHYFMPQNPDHHTIYMFNHLYLAEVCKLIHKKEVGL